jgi:hypothetical protein
MKPTVLKDCIRCGATEMIVPPIEEQAQEILQEMDYEMIRAARRSALSIVM